jgi:hypothetical protein
LIAEFFVTLVQVLDKFTSMQPRTPLRNFPSVTETEASTLVLDNKNEVEQSITSRSQKSNELRGSRVIEQTQSHVQSITMDSVREMQATLLAGDCAN